MKNIFNSILITIFLSTLLSAKNDETIQSELIQLKTSQQYTEKLTDEKITLIMGQIIQKEDELKELRNKLEEAKIDNEKIKKDFEKYDIAINNQDKRIEDINIYLFGYGVLITILLFVISYISYKFTSNEANEIVNNWIEKNKDKTLEPLRNEALFIYQERLKEFNIDDKLDEHQIQIQEETLKKVNELLVKKEKELYTFSDWYSKFLDMKNKMDYKKAEFFVDKAIDVVQNDVDLIRALFDKAYMLDALSKEKEKALDVYKEIVSKFETYPKNYFAELVSGSLNNMSIIYRSQKLYEDCFIVQQKLVDLFFDTDNKKIKNQVSGSMIGIGWYYSYNGNIEKALELYDSVINKFKYEESALLNVLDALINKFELYIINNKSIDIKDKKLYLKLSKNNKKEQVLFKMIDILNDAKIESQDEKVELWKKEFYDIQFNKNWSFDELQTWANSFEDEEVKERLLRYIETFENHNKNIKED